MKCSDLDPRKQPQTLQRILLGIFAAAFMWCLLANMGSSLPELIFHDLPIHLGIAAVLSLLLMIGYHLTAKQSHQNAAPQLAEIYALQGYCQEMADILNRKLPEPDKQDRVLCAFILANLGREEDAAEQFARIQTDMLTERQLAMRTTAKIMLLFQKGDFAKVCSLFEKYQARLDAAYACEPHFNGQFCAYVDDALEYFMLAAAYCELTQQPEQAAEYRRKALHQAKNRPAEETAAYHALTELQALYASGQADAAAQSEAALLQTVSLLKAPVSAGARIRLRQAAEQAKLLHAARLGVRTSVQQRRNPPAEHASPQGLEAL